MYNNLNFRIMNTKIKTIAVILAATSMVFFNACKKEEIPAKPVITIMEIGEGDTHGNDHTATIGGEMHVEVEIIAEGNIDKVSVRMHSESGIEGWELDTTYTKFSGLKNTTFHEHLEIDTTAVLGDYHFDFVVTDMEGNQSNAEADVLIKE